MIHDFGCSALGVGPCTCGSVGKCTKCDLPRCAADTQYCVKHFAETHGVSYHEVLASTEMVDHPAHYTRGPWIDTKFNGDDFTGESAIGRTIECIEVIRHIKDGRLFNASKYLWRVAFGGKDNDEQDIRKAIWYLNDWLENR